MRKILVLGLIVLFVGSRALAADRSSSSICPSTFCSIARTSNSVARPITMRSCTR